MIEDRMRDVIPAPVPGLDLRREYGHHQSPAIPAGGLIFCSGMVAINPETAGDNARQRSSASLGDGVA
jgi:enamine deaminase RidA (YjgF/YER057c/UK114 family)